MPRTDTERDQAVRAAKEVFWRQGYEDASVAQLVDATGFNRYALYNAFGGKLEVFLDVIDAYHAERKAIFLSSLNDPEQPPIDAIRSVMEFALSEMSERGAGCLICNTAMELGPHHAAIHERISHYLDEIRGAYTDALTRAQKRGELHPSLSPEDGAGVLMTLMMGLGTQAKHGAALNEMMNVLDAALLSLSFRKSS